MIEGAFSWIDGISNLVTIIVVGGGAAASILGIFFATRKSVQNVARKAEDDDREVALKIEEGDDALKKRLDQLEKSQDRLANRLDATPSREELHELKIEISELDGKMGRLSAQMEGMTDVLKRLETPLNMMMEHHMNSGRDK